MRRAEAYMRKGTIFLNSSSQTVDGVWIRWPPIAKVSPINCAELGRVITNALEASQRGVPHPSNWSGFDDPFLQVAGVKSWNTFARSARLVEIEFATNRVEFVPMRPMKSYPGSFDFILDKIHTSAPEDLELAQTLLNAFQDCE